MDFKALLSEATRTLPVIGETHWLKTVLSLKRFHQRYPRWTNEKLGDILHQRMFPIAYLANKHWLFESVNGLT